MFLYPFVKRFESRGLCARYAKFRAEVHSPSAGVVEAGCKIAISTLSKRHALGPWPTVTIITLRCYKLSRRFDDFCNAVSFLFSARALKIA
jgi:hypothetical protein